MKNSVSGIGNSELEGKLKISGTVTFHFEGNVSCYYNNDFVRVSCDITPELNGKISVKGSISDKLPFEKFIVTFYKVINLELTPAVVVEAEGEASAQVTVAGTLGAIWDVDNGFKNTSKLSKLEATA